MQSCLSPSIYLGSFKTEKMELKEERSEKVNRKRKVLLLEHLMRTCECTCTDTQLWSPQEKWATAYNKNKDKKPKDLIQNLLTQETLKTLKRQPSGWRPSRGCSVFTSTLFESTSVNRVLLILAALIIFLLSSTTG